MKKVKQLCKDLAPVIGAIVLTALVLCFESIADLIAPPPDDMECDDPECSCHEVATSVYR